MSDNTNESLCHAGSEEEPELSQVGEIYSPPADISADNMSPSKSTLEGLVLLQELASRMDRLTTFLEEVNKISQDRERIIDRLHQENQQLRVGEIQQVVAPLLRDLVRLYDDLNQTARAYATHPEVKIESVSKDIECFRDAVSDILYRQGIELYKVDEGTPFNPKEHKALGVVPTFDHAQDRTIARVIREGFRTESRIVRILEAEVYRLNKMEGSQASDTQQTT